MNHSEVILFTILNQGETFKYFTIPLSYKLTTIYAEKPLR